MEMPFLLEQKLCEAVIQGQAWPWKSLEKQARKKAADDLMQFGSGCMVCACVRAVYISGKVRTHICIPLAENVTKLPCTGCDFGPFTRVLSQPGIPYRARKTGSSLILGPSSPVLSTLPGCNSSEFEASVFFALPEDLWYHPLCPIKSLPTDGHPQWVFGSI